MVSPTIIQPAEEPTNITDGSERGRNQERPREDTTAVETPRTEIIQPETPPQKKKRTQWEIRNLPDAFKDAQSPPWVIKDLVMSGTHYPRSYERYSRVLSRFYSHFPDRKRTYDYLRPVFETYKTDRLNEGASPTTVAMELSVLRGFWKWMLRMETPGVLINPVVGVRVKKPSKKRRLVESPFEEQNDVTESPA
jgi:integrase